MSVSQCRCPKCETALKLTAPAEGKLLRCPRCGTTFRAGRPAQPAPKEAAKAQPRPKAPAKRPAEPDENADEAVTRKPAKRRAAAEDEEGERRPRRKVREGRANKGRAGVSPLLIGGVAAAVLAVAGIGLGVFLLLHTPAAPEKVAQNQPPAAGPGNPNVAPDGPGKPEVPPDGAGKPNVPPNQGEKPREPVAEGPPPELPPLPPPGQRPFLVLDAGGHTAAVNGVFFTPDARKVVSVSHDKTVRVWDVLSGETLRTYHLPVGPGAEGAINAGALSPDGKRLAVSGTPVGGGKLGVPVHVISLDDGRIETVLKGHTDAVTSLAFSPDGQLLASGSLDGTARVYDTAGWQLQAHLKGHKAGIRGLAFGKGGPRLATASDDKTVRLWFLRNPEANRVLTGHTETCLSVAWAPDGHSFVSGAKDGTIRLWTEKGAAAGTFEVRFRDAPTQIISLAFAPDGKRVLYTGIDYVGHAGFLDTATKKRLEFQGHTNTVMHGSVSADGKLAVTTGGNDNETFVWKVDNGAVVQKFVGAGRAAWGVGWSADGKSIAWGNTNRADTVRGAPPLERTFHLDALEVADGAVPGFRRATLSLDGYSLEPLKDLISLQLKRPDGEAVVLRSPSRGERLYSAALLPGGRALIGGQAIYLIELRNGRVLREFKGHSGIILGMATSPDSKYFVTGSTDETLRVWSPDREEPLLSLFVAGSEWIAWTPEGYYAASPYGERLMGWQVNNGPDQLASYYPAVQFRASLYQPEVIRRLLGAGSLQNAIAQVVRERKKPIAPVNLGQVLPPAVVITAPGRVPGGYKVIGKVVEVKATARSSGNNPVTALRLLMDGRPYQGQAGVKAVERPKLGEVEASWNVDVPPGWHFVAVQAESAVSKGVSAPVELVTPESGEPPSLYMVAVGISAYPGKMKLNFAASDAVLLKNTFELKARTAFKKVEVHLLTDKDATRARIVKELEWLKSVMTARDVAIFSFSGHGARDDDDNFYLIPVDANPRDVARTLLPGALLSRHLSALPGKVVALLDACHSGSVAEDMRSSRPDNLARDLVSDECGVVVMCASLGSEYSLESTGIKAGFFTLGISEGLAGAADLNKDGVIYIHELDFYAALRVRELSGGRQHTTTGRPPGIRPFALARTGP